MTNEQLYLAIGTPILINAAFFTLLALWINAKIDPVAKQVDLLVQYMISHEGKIAKLEERTK